MTDAGENQEAHAHPRGAQDEAGTATEFLHKPQTRKGASHIDCAENDLGDEGIIHPSGAKDDGAIVEEEIGTGQLLE